MKTQLDIIKIGGQLIDDEVALSIFLSNFVKNENLKILVHGGGKAATQLSQKLMVKSQMVNGRRITSAEDLEIVTMVYAGLINKSIVAKLQHLSCNAIGLCGSDIDSIKANKRRNSEIDFGFVGDIEKVNINNINILLANNFFPVFSAITHDGNGQLLNTNADTIAAQLAIAFTEIYKVRLLYCFEKSGMLTNIDDEHSAIPVLNKSSYNELKNSGVISAGMIPKLENCFEAMQQGIFEVIIGNSNIINGDAHEFTKLSLKL